MEISKELFVQQYIKEMRRIQFKRLRKIILKEINEKQPQH